MPRKKTIPTEPQPDPPAGITEATVELAPDSIEQPSPPCAPCGRGSIRRCA